MALVMGMNSGSSCDGVDCVLAEISMGHGDQPNPPKYIDGISLDWPERLYTMIWDAFNNKLDVIQLSKLNYAIGAFFGVTVKKLLEKTNHTSDDITCIGVDGQQIFLHQTDREKANAVTDEQFENDYVNLFLDDIYAWGVCFGEGNVVADYTDITTVAQFRPADHALGGQGAPLMQYVDYVLFRDKGPTLTLNIGGISNIHKVYSDRSKMKAFDCGPGNIMMDHIAKKYFGQSYDKDGAIAARGKFDEKMLAELMTVPFLSRPIPRSAWRNDFDHNYAEAMRQKYSHLSDEDVMATYNVFAAEAIAKCVNEFVENKDTDAIYASGGGAFNKTLLKNLQERLPAHMKVYTSDAIGIPPQFKEAMKFATLGYAAINHCANNIPGACLARKYAILGHICLAPKYARGTEG
jgi:anhydro-N-acetylmuramic acid kinase